jgi:predicted  nucleic acid-binding Zn-ribbon protein
VPPARLPEAATAAALVPPPATTLSPPSTASAEQALSGPTPLGAPMQDTVCWEANAGAGGRFSGTMSINDRGGVRIISGVGIRDGDRIIQRWVDDLRLCLRASGNVEFEDDGARLAGIGSGGLVVMEAQLGERLQALVIRNDGAGEQLTWRIDGAVRPVDAEVERWRAQITDVLAQYAGIVMLRGERSSLRGRISSIRGQRSSLRGQISSIRGQRSSLQGQISSIRGRRSSLRGEISAARGRVSSLRGQISSARGHVSSLEGQIDHHHSAINGLDASRYGASPEELAVIDAAQRRHEEAIDALERQLEDYDLDARVAELEQEIAAYDLEDRIAQIESRMSTSDEATRVAEIEEQIAALDVEGRVAEIEAQIEALEVEGRVAAIEAEIEALEVDERVEEMEPRLEAALRELRATIERVAS